jgi:hypothetical protein
MFLFLRKRRKAYEIYLLSVCMYFSLLSELLNQLTNFLEMW